MPDFLFSWVLALSPILLILVLMVALRWRVAKSGMLGWLIAALIAWLRFGANLELLVVAHGKALLLSLDVLLVVWAAFLFYRVTEEAGVTQIIGKMLPELTSERSLQVLLIGFVFASFLQGIAGFGVPLAIIAPILICMGYSPVKAVAIPSIGCIWVITFGTLAVAFQTLLSTSGLPVEVLAGPSALLLGLVGVLCAFMVVIMGEGWQALRTSWLLVLVISLTMTVTQYLLAVTGFWNIAAFGAGIAGIIVGILLAWIRQHRSRKNTLAPVAWSHLWIGASGYAVLLLTTLLVELTPGLGDWLDFLVIRFRFPETVTSLGFITPAGEGRVIHLFRHAGMILVYASVSAFWVYRLAKALPPGAGKRIARDVLRSLGPSSLGVATVVTMAVIMLTAGMTDTIARGLAEATGSAFWLISPWIGALGSFVTGSNTNSNLLFAMLQRRTAELLGLDAAVILAVQTTGASIGCAFAPTRIIVGTVTAGISGQEGQIIREVFVYSFLLIFLVGILALLLL